MPAGSFGPAVIVGALLLPSAPYVVTVLPIKIECLARA